MSAKALLSASVSAPPAVYVEDVFSTYLYTGTNSTQTITNGIDLAGKGGLVWIKSRSSPYSIPHCLFDTARGRASELFTNNTNAADTSAGPTSGLTAFNNNGFSLGTNYYGENPNGETQASWTFRKAEKFFDIVTYTGDGNFSRLVNHSLGSVPQFVIIKRTDTVSNWVAVCYRDANTLDVLYLNSTAGSRGGIGNYPSTPVFVSPTTFGPEWFTAGNVTQAEVNAPGGTYVAYLFANDAGGFGDSGNESIIKCGSYTGNGSTTGPVVNLGWEPQWLMIKKSQLAGGWLIFDNMRGMVSGGNDAYLRVESSNSEATFADDVTPLANGFALSSTGGNTNDSGQLYTYVAIRRGPMKTPTDATKVFAVNYETEVRTANAWSSLSGFPDDFVIVKNAVSSWNWWNSSRIAGASQTMATNTTDSEGNNSWWRFDTQSGITAGSAGFNASSASYADYHFRRAPGFFDVVAYTGTSVAGQTIQHNLGVVPELMLVKCRSANAFWRWYWAPLGATKNFYMPNDEASVTQTEIWNNTAPTSSVFSLGNSASINGNGSTFIAYLFASCPGVSKVGSYTGTGTTKQIDCGFTAGARFVLIKRTDSTGDWYVWDTARGIISGNDPFLLINSTAAENTSTDYIDPLSSGFEISSTAPAAINANGGTYIFLAIA